MNNTTIKQAVLFASDARGIYIPQHFAESFDRDMWQGYSETDRAYMTTDAVWFAVVDPNAMQQAIIDYVTDHKETI